MDTLKTLIDANIKQNGNQEITGLVLNGVLNAMVEALDAEKQEVMQNITYAELKALRDSSQLVAGQSYRITDYETTTTQEDTLSAGHSFDIILVADDEKTLNENARAIQSERDTEGYFAGSKLEAWELKYSLDNDRNRFVWADSTNGKGVIYYMKDEFGNECPYDFKNIQYKRYKIVASEKCPDLVGQYGISGIPAYSVDTEDFIFAFTFTWVNGDNEIEDASVMWTELSDVEGNTRLVNNNIILSYHKTDGDTRQEIQHLNNNVIISTHEYEEGLFYGINSNTFGNDCSRNTFGTSCSRNTLGNYCYSNTFGNYCNSNTFGDECHSNTFGNSCGSNTFGNNNRYSTFGNYCNSNTFGNECHSNTFGNNCSRNTFGNNNRYSTFGNYCNSNTFGNDCSRNTFGTSCDSNTLGNYCYSNTFGINCYSNTLGNYCDSNTFGNYCNSNTFGNYCSRNTFGTSCSRNTLGNYCDSNTFGQNDNINKVPINYCRYIRFVDNIQYVNIVNSQTASSNQVLKNIEIRDIVGTSNSRVNITADRNLDYTTFVQKNSSGEIKQFCLADLIP